MEASREVIREIDYYNLDAILSVGYRVNSKRATQFANGLYNKRITYGFCKLFITQVLKSVRIFVGNVDGR